MNNHSKRSRRRLKCRTRRYQHIKQALSDPTYPVDAIEVAAYWPEIKKKFGFVKFDKDMISVSTRVRGAMQDHAMLDDAWEK